jgi:murein endopeptidase
LANYPGQYILYGQTNTHPNSHYASFSTIYALQKIARDYALIPRSGDVLRINDISLPSGGVFDLCGTFDPATSCAGYKGGHRSHACGTDIDVATTGLLGKRINRQQLERIVQQYGGDFVIDEGDHLHIHMADCNELFPRS